MIWEVGDYPTPWRWRFAIFPTEINRGTWVWLEWYQRRKRESWLVERRLNEKSYATVWDTSAF